MALVKCAECSSLISDKAKACPKCGAPVKPKETFNCFECGTELVKGTEVCLNCGAEQPKAASDQAGSESQDPGRQRKIIAWSLALLALIFIVTFLVAKKKKYDADLTSKDSSNTNASYNSATTTPPRQKNS